MSLAQTADQDIRKPYVRRIPRSTSTGVRLKESAHGADIVYSGIGGTAIVAEAKVSLAGALTFARWAATSDATISIGNEAIPFSTISNLGGVASSGMVGTSFGNIVAVGPSGNVTTDIGGTIPEKLYSAIADTTPLFAASLPWGDTLKPSSNIMATNPVPSGYVDVALAEPSLEYGVAININSPTFFNPSYVAVETPASDYVDVIYSSPRLSQVSGYAEAVKRHSGWLAPISSRIELFYLLRDGWDSYQAKRISRKAIDRALHVAKVLADVQSQNGVQLREEPFVAPLSSGGILFEIKNEKKELHVEIDPLSLHQYSIYRSVGNKELNDDTPVNDSELVDMLSWIVRP